MSIHYPLRFVLEDGVHVQVDNTGADTYYFTITPGEGTAHTFTFTDDARPRDVKSAYLSLDELNAVRAFWLHREEE